MSYSIHIKVLVNEVEYTQSILILLQSFQHSLHACRQTWIGSFTEFPAYSTVSLKLLYSHSQVNDWVNKEEITELHHTAEIFADRRKVTLRMRILCSNKCMSLLKMHFKSNSTHSDWLRVLVVQSHLRSPVGRKYSKIHDKSIIRNKWNTNDVGKLKIIRFNFLVEPLSKSSLY